MLTTLHPYHFCNKYELIDQKAYSKTKQVPKNRNAWMSFSSRSKENNYNPAVDPSGEIASLCIVPFLDWTIVQCDDENKTNIVQREIRKLYRWEVKSEKQSTNFVYYCWSSGIRRKHAGILTVSFFTYQILYQKKIAVNPVKYKHLSYRSHSGLSCVQYHVWGMYSNQDSISHET